MANHGYTSVGLIGEGGKQTTASLKNATALWVKKEAKRRACTGREVLDDCIRAYKKLVPEACEIETTRKERKGYIPVDF